MPESLEGEEILRDCRAGRSDRLTVTEGVYTLTVSTGATVPYPGYIRLEERLVKAGHMYSASRFWGAPPALHPRFPGRIARRRPALDAPWHLLPLPLLLVAQCCGRHSA